MSLARSRRRGVETNYWPGFVDAMATLLLVVTFLLSVFMVVQFILTQVASGKDTALQRLNKQIAQLTQMLALETSTKKTLEDNLASLRVTIDTQSKEKSRLQGMIDSSGGKADAATDRASSLEGALDEQKDIGARALARVELLNQQLAALRRQIASLEEALDRAEDPEQGHQSPVGSAAHE